MKNRTAPLLLLATLVGAAARAQDGAPLPTIPVDDAAQPAAPTEPPAAADEGGGRKVEEITVTAQRTQQSLEEVPISVTAISGDFIRDTGSPDLAHVAAYVPNVRVDAHDYGSPQLFIRGFGTNTFNPSFESSVGFVQDDVYFGRAGYFTESMFDIDRVEVLRGPQGTLFGKNTIAGVFNVTSKGPTDEWSTDGRLTYGENDSKQAEAGTGGMITDWLGVRVAGMYRAQDGELYNQFLDRDEEKMHQAAGRVKLLFKPFDGVKSELLASTSSTHTHFWPYQLDRLDGDTRAYLRSFDPGIEDDPYDFRTSESAHGFIDKGTTTFALDTSWEQGDVAGLDSLTPTLVLATSRYHVDQLNDLDVSPAEIANLDSHEDHRQFSTELRFAGKDGDGPFGIGTGLSFVAGTFYYDSRYDLLAQIQGGHDLASYLATPDFLQLATQNGSIGLPGAGGIPGIPILGDLGSLVIGDDHYQFDYGQDVKSIALFGQVTWNLTDHWAITPGVRINREKKTVDTRGRSACPGRSETIPRPCVMELILMANDYDERGLHRNESDVSPKIVVQYFLDNGGNVYASYTRGFKSGGFNSISFTGEGLEFSPEKARTTELGVKGRALDDALRFSATLYYTQFSNLQVLAFNGVFFDVSNAASATSRGLEADFEWLTPWEPLSLTGSLGVLDAHYNDYGTAPAPVSDGLGTTQDLSGRRIAFAPRGTATLTPTLTVPVGPLSLRLAGDVLYQGNQYTDTDLDPATYVGAYFEFAARVILSGAEDRWSLTLGGTNLGDKRVLNQVIDATFFPGTYFAQEAAGRQVFAAVGMKF